MTEPCTRPAADFHGPASDLQPAALHETAGLACPNGLTIARQDPRGAPPAIATDAERTRRRALPWFVHPGVGACRAHRAEASGNDFAAMVP